MTRTGYTAEQQHNVKQLIFECSLAKMSSYQTQQVLKGKLNANLTVSWINKIKAEFREDARKQYFSVSLRGKKYFSIIKMLQSK